MRNFTGFLANFLLKSGEGGYLPTFVIDYHLQSCPEIFDWPKEGEAKRIGFFGNKLDPLLQESMGVIFHMGLWANGVWGREGQMGLGANMPLQHHQVEASYLRTI